MQHRKITHATNITEARHDLYMNIGKGALCKYMNARHKCFNTTKQHKYFHITRRTHVLWMSWSHFCQRPNPTFSSSQMTLRREQHIRTQEERWRRCQQTKVQALPKLRLISCNRMVKQAPQMPHDTIWMKPKKIYVCVLVKATTLRWNSWRHYPIPTAEWLTQSGE